MISTQRRQPPQFMLPGDDVIVEDPVLSPAVP